MDRGTKVGCWIMALWVAGFFVVAIGSFDAEFRMLYFTLPFWGTAVAFAVLWVLIHICRWLRL